MKKENKGYFEEIIARWGGRESSRVEYKLSESKLSKDVWETVSAFANEGGGLILLGYEEVGNKYIPRGVKNAPQLLDDFSSTIGQKFNYCPVVHPDILEDSNKEIIAIEVTEAPKYQKPIYIKDAGPLKGGFKRVGASDVRLTDEDIRRYYIERMGAPDAYSIKNTTIEQLDFGTISAFKSLRKLVNLEAPELNYDVKSLLKSYNLLADDSKTLTAAGIILFGKEQVIKRYFPVMRLDIIRIKGTKWGKDRDPFLSRDLKGNLFTLRSIALDFLNRFFLIPFRSDEKGDRIEENAHRKALRECLTNLLMHQDYFASSPAQVIIYNDRVEFYNAGYSLKNPDDFDSPGSKLRNPSIASVFYDIKWAETKGTGLQTTTEALRKEGYRLPEYKNNKKNNSFTLILPHPTMEIGGKVTPHATPQVTPQDERIKRMDRIAATIEFCKIPKSRKEIMEFLNLKDRKYFMESILKPLIKKRYLIMILPDKPKSPLQKYVALIRKPGKKE